MNQRLSLQLRKQLGAGLLYMICAFAINAQTTPIVGPVRLSPVFSRVPLLPPDGHPPADLADKYFVYFDVSSYEYIVSYPEHLVTGLPDSGRRIVFRFESQATVEPSISSKAVRQANGEFR